MPGDAVHRQNDPMKPSKPIESLILTLRGERVILDADLAELYGVPTKALNQAVKRNADRFPQDFRWQLTAEEWDECAMRSQIVTASKRNVRHFPYAFTEHGALQAANVLKSERAVAMSVYVVRAFIKQREMLMAQADVLKRLAQMDAKLLQQDDALRVIWRELQPLLNPPPDLPRPRIGFKP